MTNLGYKALASSCQLSTASSQMLLLSKAHSNRKLILYCSLSHSFSEYKTLHDGMVTLMPPFGSLCQNQMNRKSKELNKKQFTQPHKTKTLGEKQSVC